MKKLEGMSVVTQLKKVNGNNHKNYCLNKIPMIKIKTKYHKQSRH